MRDLTFTASVFLPDMAAEWQHRGPTPGYCYCCRPGCPLHAMRAGGEGQPSVLNHAACQWASSAMRELSRAPCACPTAPPASSVGFCQVWILVLKWWWVYLLDTRTEGRVHKWTGLPGPCCLCPSLNVCAHNQWLVRYHLTCRMCWQHDAALPRPLTVFAVFLLAPCRVAVRGHTRRRAPQTQQHSSISPTRGQEHAADGDTHTHNTHIRWPLDAWRSGHTQQGRCSQQ